MTATAPIDAGTLLEQIGPRTVLSVCGGRVRYSERLVRFVCGYGYRVEVELAADDTYTVRRVFERAGDRFVHGEQTRVHWPEVGEAVYRAGMFRDPWPAGGAS